MAFIFQTVPVAVKTQFRNGHNMLSVFNRYGLNILLLLMCILIVSCKKNDVDFKSTVKSEVPVFIGANNVEYFSAKNNKINGVIYDIDLPYPTKKVLEFYEYEMSKRGFTTYLEQVDTVSDREWSTYRDVSKQDKYYVAKLVANWKNLNSNKSATLILMYKWKIDEAQTKYVLTENFKMEVKFQEMTK